MLLAPELIMPELEAPTDGTYEELLEGHDWETHLPPSPEGRLIRTADYCPCCDASVHFLLGPEGVAILAARFTVPAAAPGHQPPTRLFLLEHGRMERKAPEACRQALREINPGPDPAWSVPVSQDGQPRWEEKHQPLEPQLAPAFRDILKQHQWKQERKQRRNVGREGEYLHDCAVCRARMHVHLDSRGRIAQVRVRLPAARECHYQNGGNGVTPVTGAQFYGQEPMRLTQEQLDAREKLEKPESQPAPPEQTRRPPANRTKRT